MVLATSARASERGTSAGRPSASRLSIGKPPALTRTYPATGTPATISNIQRPVAQPRDPRLPSRKRCRQGRRGPDQAPAKPQRDKQQKQDTHILVKEEERVLQTPVETRLHHHEPRGNGGDDQDRHAPVQQACKPRVAVDLHDLPLLSARAARPGILRFKDCDSRLTVRTPR